MDVYVVVDVVVIGVVLKMIFYMREKINVVLQLSNLDVDVIGVVLGSCVVYLSGWRFGRWRRNPFISDILWVKFIFFLEFFGVSMKEMG